MSEQDPTADYRKYSKGPKFGLIVGLSVATFLIFFVIVILFLRRDATKVDPHGPTKTPNSHLLFPLPPVTRSSRG